MSRTVYSNSLCYRRRAEDASFSSFPSSETVQVFLQRPSCSLDEAKRNPGSPRKRLVFVHGSVKIRISLRYIRERWYETQGNRAFAGSALATMQPELRAYSP
jgi:hypothetical protein